MGLQPGWHQTTHPEVGEQGTSDSHGAGSLIFDTLDEEKLLKSG